MLVVIQAETNFINVGYVEWVEKERDSIRVIQIN